jgi:hypothetical protein
MHFHHCKPLKFIYPYFVFAVIHFCELSPPTMDKYAATYLLYNCFRLCLFHTVGLKHMFLSLYRRWLETGSNANGEISTKLSNIRNYAPKCELGPKNHYISFPRSHKSSQILVNNKYQWHRPPDCRFSLKIEVDFSMYSQWHSWLPVSFHDGHNLTSSNCVNWKSPHNSSVASIWPESWYILNCKFHENFVDIKFLSMTQ